MRWTPKKTKQNNDLKEASKVKHWIEALAAFAVGPVATSRPGPWWEGCSASAQNLGYIGNHEGSYRSMRAP